MDIDYSKLGIDPEAGQKLLDMVQGKYEEEKNRIVENQTRAVDQLKRLKEQAAPLLEMGVDADTIRELLSQRDQFEQQQKDQREKGLIEKGEFDKALEERATQYETRIKSIQEAHTRDLEKVRKELDAERAAVRAFTVDGRLNKLLMESDVDKDRIADLADLLQYRWGKDIRVERSEDGKPVAMVGVQTLDERVSDFLGSDDAKKWIPAKVNAGGGTRPGAPAAPARVNGVQPASMSPTDKIAAALEERGFR